MKMKSLLMALAMFSLLITATSCNNTKSTNDSNDTEEVKEEKLVGENKLDEEEKVEMQEDDAAIQDFITNMYENHLYYEYDFLEAHCSEGMLQYLKDQYEYDGEGYAVWLFRTSSQDGKPGAEGVKDKVHSITKDSEGWYHYTFTDAGWNGENKLKVHVENGKVVIDDLKCVYDEDAERYH